MDNPIQIIIFIIMAGIFLFGRVLSRRSRRQTSEPPEDEVMLPPWGNMPSEEQEPAFETIESEAAWVEPPPVEAVPEPTPPPRVSATPSPERRPGSSPTKAPEIAGIPLTPRTFREGIILAEILGRPKSHRHSRR